MSPNAILIANRGERVGPEAGDRGWFTVTRDDVHRFAAVTRDPRFIHVDPERAEGTPFGGIVTVEVEGEAEPALVAEWLALSIV